MITVKVIDKFNTSMGTTLIIEDNPEIRIGQTVHDEEGTEYTIRSIVFPTRPVNHYNISIVVDRANEEEVL